MGRASSDLSEAMLEYFTRDVKKEFSPSPPFESVGVRAAPTLAR